MLLRNPPLTKQKREKCLIYNGQGAGNQPSSVNILAQLSCSSTPSMDNKFIATYLWPSYFLPSWIHFRLN